MCRKGAELMPLPFKEKSNHTSSKQHEKEQKQKKQSHGVPLLFLSATPMHLPRLWTDAPVAKSKSRGEQNSKRSKGSTQGPQHTRPEKEEKEKPATHNEKKGLSGNHRGRREGRGAQGGEDCTHHIRIATVQLSGA